MARPSRKRVSLTIESQCTPTGKQHPGVFSPSPMPKRRRLDPTSLAAAEKGRDDSIIVSLRGKKKLPEVCMVAAGSEIRMEGGEGEEEGRSPGRPDTPDQSIAEVPCSRVLSYEEATCGSLEIPEGTCGSAVSSVSTVPIARGMEALRAVKAALHLSADVDTAVCREAESARIRDSCRACIVSRCHGNSGSLYVSGCPGTGKSLAVAGVARSLSDWCSQEGHPQTTVITVNCMTLTEPRQIFPKILNGLRTNEGVAPLKKVKKGVRLAESAEDLKEALRRRSGEGLVVIVIDEMDHLITKDQSVLYQIFGLTNVPEANCFIIGIANAVDLTDRFLPNLHALKCHPEVVTFQAYNKDQILTILQQRLKDLPISPFDPLALELCSRKVAAATGDMRKALDICRIALEMVEAAALSDSTADDLDWTTKKVTISHMAQALSATFKSPVVETIQSLPQHQQMALCSAVRLFGRGKKDATLGEVNDAYLSLCRASAVQPLTTSEFGGVCMVLAEQGLLNLGFSREERKRRVTLKIHRDDVAFALQGVRFFRNILASCSEPMRGA